MYCSSNPDDIAYCDNEINVLISALVDRQLDRNLDDQCFENV